MKYGVKFTYVERGYVEIDAESEDEAIELLEDAIAGGNVTWDNSDVTEAEATLIESNRSRDNER
ncbi:MAG: hypothetical protein IJW55_06975 [Clostridia bacterium]|nr:hypothetical protein [Clostridia bacterium]